MKTTTADILAQFNQMKQSGAIDSLESLKKENIELERVINDILMMVSNTDVDSILQFIIAKFLDYFIPQSMIFVLKPPRKDILYHYFYRSLTRINAKFPEGDYETLKKYFNEHPDSSTLFVDVLANLPPDSLTTECLAINPVVVIPLNGIGGVYGIVVLSEKITAREYSGIELLYMQRMFIVLALTIQNGLHYESSITDPKTGLFTYDYFVRRTQEIISHCHRYKNYAGLLMLDIDYFKKFNDTWGHLAGDRALVALAQVLTEQIRTEDCISRYGGEEFAILLSECDKDSILPTAERVREAISEIRILEGDVELSFTVSIGICFISPDDDITPKTALAKADKALYFSKKGGRNRSTIFTEGLYAKALSYNKLHNQK